MGAEDVTREATQMFLVPNKDGSHENYIFFVDFGEGFFECLERNRARNFSGRKNDSKTRLL